MKIPVKKVPEWFLKGVPDWNDPAQENLQIGYFARSLLAVMEDANEDTKRAMCARLARMMHKALELPLYTFAVGGISTIAAGLNAAPQTCMVCGCTDFDPCRGGCSWAGRDVCSECVDSWLYKESLKERASEVKE